MSRCVCRAWRAAVDGRRLLRADLLPRTVHGVLLEHNELDFPALLCRPSSSSSTGPDINILAGISPDRGPGWRSYACVLDHCNGLLLLQDPRGMLVSNPVTHRWARLPPPPRSLSGARLAFDPADSPQYQVLLVPMSRRIEDMDTELRLVTTEDVPISNEWPPPAWILCAFSSQTGKWEERSFAREGEPPEMASDEDSPIWEGCAAYWRGTLYVQCRTGASSVVIRISLSNDKYRVIKVPADIGLRECNFACLGRSEKGVCCASIHGSCSCMLRVWILDESCGQEQWVLNHHIDLKPTVSRVMDCEAQLEGPWMLQDYNNGEDYGQEMLHDVNDGKNSALEERRFEWDSDNDNVLDFESEVEQKARVCGYATLLGFHPYKDIIFLNISLRKVAAYHLSTSKVQVLGDACPEYYNAGHAALIESSFPYTPCLIAEFPENKIDAPVED